MRAGFLASAVLFIFGALSASAPKLAGDRILSQGLGLLQGRDSSTVAALAESGIASSALPEQPQSGDMAALYGDFERQLEKMTPEEREMYKEMSPQLELVTNPMVQKLLGGAKKTALSGGGGAPAASVDFSWAKQIALQLRAYVLVARTVYYPKYKTELLFVMWAAPLTALATAMALLLLGYATAAGALGQLVFRFSSLALLFLSFISAAAYLVFKINLLAFLPWECWSAAVVFIFGGALVLRCVDMNYPFWNYTLTSLSTPVLASCLVLFWSVLFRVGTA